MDLRRVGLAVVLLAGCARSSPLAAVKALEAAAKDGDRAEVMALLGPRTLAALTEDARVASEQAGRRRLTPAELLAVGWSAPSDELVEVREVERQGDRAQVELVGKRGARQRLEVVRVDGAWRVELP